MGSITAHWSWDPALIYVTLAAVMYVVGGMRRGASRSPMAIVEREPIRELAFAAGLLSIVIALDSPIDYYSDQLFWVHMSQHIILLTVSPPLILLGRPWPRMWQALPMRWRTAAGRTLVGARWTAPVRALARPWPAWVLFNANMLLWHIPGAYDLTLGHQWIHDCEHALFFFTGLLFWAHVVDPGPLRHRMTWFVRAGYVTGAMVAGWILAITLVVVQHPLYAHYADLLSRPGGISALDDQQIAGGMMWVPGSISYTVALIAIFWRWATPESDRARQRPAAAV
jgi:cytochrome c oxidase assembly factor CtaG